MKTLETYAPRRGLSIPCVTILDADGQPVDSDQRRLVRFLTQSGRGADILFAMGTTGEWNRLDQANRHRVIRVTADEVKKQNDRLAQAGENPVEIWIGVTAPTARETLETLELALELEAHAGVIAPLAIADVGDPMRFMMRDVADLMDAHSRRLPTFLYDNADIATGEVRHLKTQWIKQWSRLDFVRGIKVSAPPRRLGHYTRAARTFRDLGAFGIYVGNALHILEGMRPQVGVMGTVREHWNRWLMRDMLPSGVVSGPANLWPREWQRAWRVASAGDIERMDELREFFERFGATYRFPKGKRSLAALKRGLLNLGVISSDAVGAGTPALAPDEAARFDADFAELRAAVADALPAHWVSDGAEADA